MDLHSHFTPASPADLPCPRTDDGAELLRHLTLRQLHIFRVAARSASYAEAATRLHLTQPAVSMQLAQLSESLGAPLFERHGRTMLLSRHGRALLPYADAVAATLVQARQLLRSL